MTARRRVRRTTSRSVYVAERTARSLITVGGIGTILAVLGICVFLVWVVLPLFHGADVHDVHAADVADRAPGASIAATGIDEHRVLTWELGSDGVLRVRSAADGALLETRAVFPGRRPTAIAHDASLDTLSFGFEDGSVAIASVVFATRFFETQELPAEVRERAAALGDGEVLVQGGGVVQRTPEGQLRRQELDLDVEEPVATDSASPVVLVDHSGDESARLIAALHEDGSLGIVRRRTRVNRMTDEVTVRVDRGPVPYAPERAGAPGDRPDHMRLAGSGSMLYLVWSDGRLQRFDTRSLDAMQLAERVDTLEGSAAVVTRVGMAIGKTSLLVGDSAGRVGIWFPVRPQGGTDTPDAAALVRGKVLEPGAGAAAVTAIAPSARSRLVAVGYEDGSARLFFATSAASLGGVDAPRAEPIVALAFAPKEDALLASTPTGAWSATFEARHPEASFRGIFRPVWYEGYEKPEHAWQSSSGTDDFEPKLGMMPLVFGTLKATVYSMLFGVPLALLAAIYSSEFLSPRVRVPVKSTIEMMASLPSVVLGFLAAMILAPFVQSVVPAVFAALLTVPMSLLLGAYLWQLLPAAVALRRESLRILAVGACIPIGVLAAFLLGPVVESLLFAGDIMSWLDGQVGGPFGGWFVLLLPLVALLVALMAGRVVQPWLRGLSTRWDRNKCARADLVKFLAASAVVAVLTSVLAFAIGAAGIDPRNSVLGTYEQRNALVVGFVMGFAIVPIIYTLAEDALSSVPSHLREASYGCGATPWQTAVRVIVPTATSGLFSACMIGLGRAVGETMIVLMATGNTAIMDWNVFNGFRTLSANIAVELPEAVVGSTHYRMLFLAALVLFALTFVINTLAEVVRQRFRRRAFQL